MSDLWASPLGKIGRQRKHLTHPLARRAAEHITAQADPSGHPVAVIFDMDGTLVDVTSIRRHLTGESPADFSFTTGDLAGLLADLGVER